MGIIRFATRPARRSVRRATRHYNPLGDLIAAPFTLVGAILGAASKRGPRTRTCAFCGRQGTREFGRTRKTRQTACMSVGACNDRIRRANRTR